MMTDKLTKRMKALITLAHYSTEIKLTLPIEFLASDKGINWSFTEELQDCLTCLLEDKHNDTTYTSDEDIVEIHIKAKGEE